MSGMPPDTALIKLCAGYVVQETAALDHHQAELGTPGLPDHRVQQIEDEATALCAQADKVLALVIATPAMTMDGLAAKARCAVAYRGEIISGAIGHPNDTSDRTVCLSIIQDLVGQSAITAALRADGREVEVPEPMPPPHPDAELLDLCRRLSEQQAEWQRLYDLTSDTPKLTTPADHDWATYASTVWPGVGPLMTKMASRDDLPAQLGQHRATTMEGMAAKAAAILHLQDAARYTIDCRDDSCELADSLMEDVAGAAYQGLGEKPTAASAGTIVGGADG